MTSTAKAACDQCGWTKTYASQAYATDRLRRHSCDQPLCANPRHLFLGSPKDNTADMIAKGRAGDTRRTQFQPRSHCHHKQANHQHGTHACINRRSGRAGDCRACANERKRRRRAGRPQGENA